MIGRLDHLFSGMLSRPVIDLAEALAGLAPGSEQGAAVDDGRRVQRGRAAAGEDGDGRLGGRRVRPELARHDRRRGRGDVLGRTARPRSGSRRIDGGVRAERLPAAVHRPRRQPRLAHRARRRLRPDRSSERRRSGGLHRRAAALLGRHPRPSTRLPRRPAGALPRAGDAADPRRSADRSRSHRHDVRVRARRDRARHPDAVEDARRRSAVGGGADHRRDRGAGPRARLPLLHDPRLGPAARRGRPEGDRGRRARPSRGTSGGRPAPDCWPGSASCAIATTASATYAAAACSSASRSSPTRSRRSRRRSSARRSPDAASSSACR